MDTLKLPAAKIEAFDRLMRDAGARDKEAAMRFKRERAEEFAGNRKARRRAAALARRRQRQAA